ncbi:flagellin [Pseudorhodoferax sp. Leaf274]|uniref:flagellin N-terminal helical domain-containing protein n=1 Tax=Pseudorhodoferax sp. Leaf274 TaxID=1736318 RepID=UPI0007027DC5|nr:flagellin [Pseudorhodoferax sp. Leaf274]KQP37202.1 Lateral flagellin [Pseudorhodoferax sp. Leaf274]
MLSLHTNAASLTGQNTLTSTNKALTTSLTRLSTGYRVNSAMDDAAGLQIATRLNSQTRGMAVAQRNTQNGISMLQTAEGALQESTNILLRMKDLATEAASDTASTDDRTAISAELTALEAELTNIFTNTSFGGRTLFTGTNALTTATQFQIGASASETLTLASLTIPTTFASTVTAVTDAATGTAAITTIDTKITELSTFRSGLGAISNRLDHVFNNLGNMSTNTEAARGRIMDVDYASESANMTTKQMLMQAGTSMLKQSNAMSQLALSLLQ